jgi:hypothetical protein
MSLQQKFEATLNRLVKWRSVFAGWQLGTRSINDSECQAVRDHREVTILMRTEISAMIKLLTDKGFFTVEEFQKGMIEEAELLSKDYERKFPGMKATDVGIQYDSRASETMKHWKP